MQKLRKKQLYVGENLAPLLALELEAKEKKSAQRKRRRKRKKNTEVTVKENCSTEELRTILETIDGDREILRTSDGRRVRTKTLTVKRSAKERMMRQNEITKRSRKIKKAMIDTFSKQVNHHSARESEPQKIILPIEQALNMVEVMGIIQEDIE